MNTLNNFDDNHDLTCWGAKSVVVCLYVKVDGEAIVVTAVDVLTELYLVVIPLFLSGQVIFKVNLQSPTR